MDLGALAIQKYKEIAASAEPDAIQDEMVQISMVRLMASQLRRELQTTASAQGNSKREASG